MYIVKRHPPVFLAKYLCPLTHPRVAELYELLSVNADGVHDGVRVVLDQPVPAFTLHLTKTPQKRSKERKSG